MKRKYGWKNITRKRIEQVETCLKQQVKTFIDYLSGSVYGYIVEDDEGEAIDSCWGFYGYDDIEYMKTVARDVIDSIAE